MHVRQGPSRAGAWPHDGAPGANRKPAAECPALVPLTKQNKKSAAIIKGRRKGVDFSTQPSLPCINRGIQPFSCTKIPYQQKLQITQCNKVQIIVNL
jgi:hypothetical protein